MKDIRRHALILIVLFLFVGIVSCAPSVGKQLNKGIEYGALGKFNKAKEEFQKVLANTPGQSFQAVDDCMKLTEDVIAKRIEDEVVIHLFKGVLYGNKGMTKEAIEEISKSIDINPNYADAHYFLGAAYVANGMLNKGIIEYKKAIVLNSNYVQAYNNLAISFFYAKEYQLAIDNYDKSIELGYEVDPVFSEYLESYRGLKSLK